MIKKLIAALIVVAVLGTGSYFFFSHTNANQQHSVSAVDKISQDSSAPANSEFWTKRCNPEPNNYCEIFQRLSVKETNKRLIELAVGYPAESKGAAQAAIIVPYGVLLSKGITIQVDDKKSATGAFSTCNDKGCYAVFNVPDEFLDLMKQGKELIVAFSDSASG